MNIEHAETLALAAVAFILSDDMLKDRFLDMTGVGGQDLRANLESPDFLASMLEFLIRHEPDLMAFAAHTGEKPDTIATAWRVLGGGKGQEW